MPEDSPKKSLSPLLVLPVFLLMFILGFTLCYLWMKTSIYSPSPALSTTHSPLLHTGPQYEFLQTWGSEGSDPGQFHEPIDAILDKEGFLLVTDWYNCRIQKFDPSGRFELAFGSCGKDSGQFDIPLSIGLDKDENIYVLEAGNARVQKFDPLGKFILQFGTLGKRKRPVKSAPFPGDFRQLPLCDRPME